MIKNLKCVYVVSSDITYIYYECFKFGKWKETFKQFSGRLKFKNKNPTKYELIKLIKMKGG